ncbi:MAG: cation:dicarboxylase symporter family transporter [Bacteroidales bacterium]|nr:cation:dicarboxylase symporter family transporter [Bacteroidales bacterium]
MKIKGFFQSTIAKLLISIVIGVGLGYLMMLIPQRYVSIPLQFFMIAKDLTSQIILFIVPFIIIGCVAPSITGFSGNVGKLLGFTIFIAFTSSLLAALMAMGVGYAIVPFFKYGSATQLVELPKAVISLSFPTMDTLSALLLAFLLGLGTVWIGSEGFKKGLEDFQALILKVVSNVMVPILPLFIGSNFALLAYSGRLAMMKVYLPAILAIITMQLVWIVLCYLIASAYTGKNGFKVARLYPKPYFTAVGTMSSAATLPVALECVSKSELIDKKTTNFALPLFCNIHLCGSVITEIFLVLTTYYTFFGTFPSLSSMLIFLVLVCVIAIGSPGVPGGINMSCIGLVYSLLIGHEDTSFFAVMTAIYAIQDGFGTACNVTCDGALTLMTDKFCKKK